MTKHKAGFVSIVGKPNVGKSTLMNCLVGEKLAITTFKAQTTRHRIMGILNGDDYQIVYSDTPGIITPKYALQKAMMKFVSTALEDADVILYVADIREPLPEAEILDRIRRVEVPVVLVLNKVDLSNQEQVEAKVAEWEAAQLAQQIVPVSALHQFNAETILPRLLSVLPEHEPFFDKEELTDKPERFFASEIIREKIFLNYDQEVPYSTEVVIVGFREDEKIIRISAEILVERDSQKAIIIGKKGSMLKKVGTEARKDMEAFFGKQVFLEQFVKVEPEWRKKQDKLERFGYLNRD